MKDLHLICNAHIDPVWLWDIEEGISAALSTFRMAAGFCREYDGLVFNHNEAFLYEWIEELEPELFDEIRKLVIENKWHIMGGWYLQPDCNMPNGESFLRQMEYGRRYFLEKFGKVPAAAINLDSFGHSRGLVQLMTKAGYDSYLFCRPGQGDCPLPSDDFVWVGFDGSRIMGHRADTYGSLKGEAGKGILEWQEKQKKLKSPPLTGCMLWGVGNHGGGPSREDLEEIGQMMKTGGGHGWKLMHSTPEKYFTERRQLNKKAGTEEPEVAEDLNSWAVGCYTSQIRIKRGHRELEGELSVTEKMLSQAAIKGLLSYPEKDLWEARKALMFCEFHDVLPGTSIPSVEERCLGTLQYGLEIVLRWKRRAFFALLKGQETAGEGEYPVLIYNPHPYEIEGDFSCEFQLAGQNWTERYALPMITGEGQVLLSQVEKESCNINLDWRKKLTFHGKLKPSSMNRFSVTIEMREEKSRGITLIEKDGICETEEYFIFDNGSLYAAVKKSTGLLEVYRVNGKDYLKAGACMLRVMKSDCDPWGMNRHDYREEEGFFTLLSGEEGSIYSGTANEGYRCGGKLIPGVRVIESGPVRTVVEAVFGYKQSRACLKYVFSRHASSVELLIRVDWAEKGKFLKLELPACFAKSDAYSETAYGIVEQKQDGEEKVIQRWCGLWEQEESETSSPGAFTVINTGNYGADFLDGIIRISLLHSAAYSAHPIGDRPLLAEDRFLPYMDQGERNFSFLLQGGERQERRAAVWREAIQYQEAPMVLQAFPAGKAGQPGEEECTGSAVLLEGDGVALTAWREAARPGEYLIRLLETLGKKQRAILHFPVCHVTREVEMEPYEVKTLKLIPEKNRLVECGILGD